MAPLAAGGVSETRRKKRATKPRPRRQRQFSAEPLEERIMLSATTPPAAAQAALGKLTDPAVQQLAQADYAATQSITRNDLLSIFTEVEQDHVVDRGRILQPADALANATTVGMPGYVAELAGKVVNGDPANIYLNRLPARTAICSPVARPRSSSRL